MQSKRQGLVWMIIVGLMAMTGLTACTLFFAEQEQEQELVYVGRVIDRTTQEPIGGARVALDFRGAPPVVYTDSEGVYRFVVVMTGTRLDGRVRVSADEYEPYDRNITLYTTSSTVEDLRLSKEGQAESVEPPTAEATEATVFEPTEEAEVALVVTPPTAVPSLPTATAEPTATFTPPPPPTATNTPEPTHTPTPAPPEAGDPWVRPIDNMTMRFVPGGSFMMGSEDGDDDEKPVREVSVDEFWIDQTEVTNFQYAQCVQAEECEWSEYATDANYNGMHQPVAGVSWYDAEAYCTWVSGRLPTEAEWEYAARGPGNNSYPWGDDVSNCAKAQVGLCSGGTTVNVGSFSPAGDSWIGAQDMAGNVWEWVADWYEADYYSFAPDDNPQGPEDGSSKVLRGGSWVNDARVLRSAYRSSSVPTNRLNGIGFRCAYPGP